MLLVGALCVGTAYASCTAVRCICCWLDGATLNATQSLQSASLVKQCFSGHTVLLLL